MKLFDLAKKHFALFLVLFLALGCSFDLGKKTTRNELPTKQKQNTKTKTNDDEPPSRNSGGTPQELVGKWCYLANVQANDGGRMSERCFVLNSDGTYQYHAETSNSNPYGGSSSETNDSGRWTATATTITAQSNSGQSQTYTLEKRNHPKTGDPMLIVDGDAFVTFYQKQPW